MSKKAQGVPFIDPGAWIDWIQVCWTQVFDCCMMPIRWILSFLGMGGALPFVSEVLGGIGIGGASLLMLLTTFAISPLAFSSALIVLVIVISLMFKLK